MFFLANSDSLLFDLFFASELKIGHKSELKNQLDCFLKEEDKKK